MMPQDFTFHSCGKCLRLCWFRLFTFVVGDAHVTQTVSSCIGSLCQINRVKHLFDARTLERVINALVFSKLYYCSPVWSNTSKKNISKLQKVQNFACRIITGKRKFDHITPVLRELRWLPVTSFLKYTLATFVVDLRHVLPFIIVTLDIRIPWISQLISQLLGNAHFYIAQRVSGILFHVK